MGSIPNDWICRVFMLRTDMESTAAMHVIYNNNYFGKVELGKHTGEDIYSYQNNNGARKNEKLVSDVKEGDIFSIALRVNRLRDLVGGANDVWGPWIGQGGKINPKDYAFKIWQSNHILLSLHVSQEDLEVHPNDVLYPSPARASHYSFGPSLPLHEYNSYANIACVGVHYCRGVFIKVSEDYWLLTALPQLVKRF
nr:uncharacterized protein LOC119168573 [Rhipicephalus microplus]